MKTIDLGESPQTEVQPSRKNRKWYPTIDYSDNGKEGVSSFDDKDIGKPITVKAKIRLVSINIRSDKPNGKLFDYSFEVHEISMPENLSKQGKKNG